MPDASDASDSTYSSDIDNLSSALTLSTLKNHDSVISSIATDATPPNTNVDFTVPKISASSSSGSESEGTGSVREGKDEDKGW